MARHGTSTALIALSLVLVLGGRLAQAQPRDPPFLVVIRRDAVTTLSSTELHEYGIRDSADARIGSQETACEAPEAVGALEVPLRNGGTSWCSGTLITPRHVLTAAHCLDEATTAGGWFRVGENPSMPTQRYRIVRRSVFGGRAGLSGYSPQTWVGDVAVLELERPVEDVAPIGVLAAIPDSLLESELQVVGFGRRPGGEAPLGRRRCVRSVLGTPGPGHYFGPNRQGVCMGDSGGPLFVRSASGRSRLVGVVSRGDPECRVLQLHTNLAPYLRWIREESGQAVSDNDEDDVPDSDDRCPNAPESRNGFADHDGCPDGPRADGAHEMVFMTDDPSEHFEIAFGSGTLRPSCAEVWLGHPCSFRLHPGSLMIRVRGAASFRQTLLVPGAATTFRIAARGRVLSTVGGALTLLGSLGILATIARPGLDTLVLGLIPGIALILAGLPILVVDFLRPSGTVAASPTVGPPLNGATGSVAVGMSHGALLFAGPSLRF